MILIEKALQIMLFMWAVSFSILGVQYVIGDVIGTEVRNYRGEPLRSHVIELINQDQINRITENIVSANFTDNSTRYDRVETYDVAASFVAWELVLLLTGTYIFSILVFLGVPPIFVTGLAVLYFALLARAIVGYIRGV